MSSSVLNQVYKYGIFAVEESTVTNNLTANDGTTVSVSCKVMTQTPFTAGKEYLLRDDQFDSSGNSNCERIHINYLGSDCTAIPISDGVGYTFTGTLHVAGWTSTGFTGSLTNSYSDSSNCSILIPGIEMAIQSSDFVNRFKTLTDTPKIDFDDEASRFATGDEGRDPSIAGARSGEISFTEKLAWAGDATTVPVWGKLMRTMGHEIHHITNKGVEILPMPTANECTATVWIISPENDSVSGTTVYRYCGAHGGNGSSISCGKIGDPYMLTGKYSAAYIGTTELSTAQYRALGAVDTNIPEVLLNNTCSVPSRVNGSTVNKNVYISQFSLDFGGVVNGFINQETSTGYGFFATQDRDVKLTINPYKTNKNLDDIDYVASNMVQGKVTIQSALTNPHITIEVPRGQMMNPAEASREGYQNTNRTYRALRNNLGAGVSDANIPDKAMYSVLIGSRT